ncbi:uncharacterized protein ARMOST_06344 [Armillaria ostoyae]|uniref:Uncharacterized protein n=1 Tax=Armillaria ostoyae TaxID=47428 RepID=A0A284R2P2_ARMOS|nr:uncharacterized protein ARMOST_06344 [Armillaria ostoyae]
MADNSPEKDFLDDLKNLPKLGPTTSPEKTPVQEHSADHEDWCGSEMHPDADEEHEDDDDDDILVNTGEQAYSPPKHLAGNPSSLSKPATNVTGKDKNLLKRKQSALGPNIVDATTPAGPASNTRSMRAQTESAFAAASGQPSPSIVPKKRRKTKDVPGTALTSHPLPSFTHFVSAVPSIAAAGPSASPFGSDHLWKTALVELRTHIETQLLVLQQRIESVETHALSSMAQPPSLELADIRDDISNLQTRFSDLSKIATGRFREHFKVISDLMASLSALVDLPSALDSTNGHLTALENDWGSSAHHHPSRDAFRALEERVADLEKASLSASIVPAVPATVSWPLPNISHSAQLPSRPPVPIPSINSHRQIIISSDMPFLKPFDAVAQMMGCIQNLSMSSVLDVKTVPGVPTSILVSFRLENDAKDFMIAARTLPARFHGCRFLWPDSPAAPATASLPLSPLASSSNGPIVDDRHGYFNDIHVPDPPCSVSLSPSPDLSHVTSQTTSIDEPLPLQTLSLCSWNINGHLPLKIWDPEVTSVIKRHDVTVFFETWLMPHTEASVRVPPNYTAIFRSRSYSGGRPWGGLCAVVKDDLRYLVIDELSRPDLLVLQLPSCYLVAGYVAPATSKACTRAIIPPFQHFAEAVTFLSTNSTLPVVGLTDVNGRVGTRSPANAPMSFSRAHAVDVKRDTRGKEFIDMCYDSKMVILNGLRITTDYRTFNFDNSWTSFQTAGTSVVDYAFVSQSLLLLPDSLNFSIGKKGPADHAPLSVSVASTEALYTSTGDVNDSAPKIKDLREELQSRHAGPLNDDMHIVLDSIVSMTPSEPDRMHLYGASCPCIKKQSNIPCFSVYIVSPPENSKSHRLLTTAIHWGLYASRNRTIAYGAIPDMRDPNLPSNGPAKQRVLLAGIAVALASLEVDSPLQIIVDSQDIIDLVCYEAPLHAVKGWVGSNDDILRKVVDCLTERRGTTEFVLCRRGIDNHTYKDAIDAAREASRHPGSSSAHMGKAEWTDLCETFLSDCAELEHAEFFQHDDDCQPGPKIFSHVPYSKLPSSVSSSDRNSGKKMKGQQIKMPPSDGGDIDHFSESHRGRHATRKAMWQNLQALTAVACQADFWKLIRSWSHPSNRSLPKVSDYLSTQRMLIFFAPLQSMFLIFFVSFNVCLYTTFIRD